jgi:hypothetical protein
LGSSAFRPTDEFAERIQNFELMNSSRPSRAILTRVSILLPLRLGGFASALSFRSVGFAVTRRRSVFRTFTDGSRKDAEAQSSDFPGRIPVAGLLGSSAFRQTDEFVELTQNFDLMNSSRPSRAFLTRVAILLPLRLCALASALSFRSVGLAERRRRKVFRTFMDGSRQDAKEGMVK